MVAKMQKNVFNQVSCSSFLRDRQYREWNASLDRFLPSQMFQECSNRRFKDEKVLSTACSLSEETLCEYQTAAETGVSQIQDPLWRRVCIDVLRMLGPVAFNDLWKTNLISISPKEKRAYLNCPTQDIAATVENYHFVIMDALKKFYPFLFSIETEINEKESPHRKGKGSKVSVGLYRHLT